MVVIVAGELRRKLLLAKNEDLNFGYGVRSAALLAVLHNTSLIGMDHGSLLCRSQAGARFGLSVAGALAHTLSR